jgi:hypothetical protein
MEPRSLRVGPDGAIQSALRTQLAANPLHNLSYAQNVGYALPGFTPTLASSESAGHDSILKGWQYLSPYGVSSLNVSNAGSSAPHAAATSAFPGLNYRATPAAASAPTASAAAAAAAASAAAIKAQKQLPRTVTLGSSGQPESEPHGIPPMDPYQRLNPHQFRTSFDLGELQSQQQQRPVAGMSTSTSAMLARSAVTAPSSALPRADFVAGGEFGSAAAAALAAAQLQHTLAASQQSNIRRSATTSSDFVSGRLSESSDRVCCFRVALSL